jgi:hypothetical protein
VARADAAWVAFALAFFVFHQAPSTFFGPDGEAAVDVLTPFVVVAAGAALVVAAGGGASAAVWTFFGVAAVLYVHGHGAHLSANSIHNSGVENDTVYFWDERFSHIEAVLGWFGLVAAACVAERGGRADAPARRALLAAGAVVLGWTFFTSTVEGQTWWLQLPAAVVFVAWAARDRRPLVVAAAGAFAVGAALIGVWAAIHGGVPEFSDL